MVPHLSRDLLKPWYNHDHCPAVPHLQHTSLGCVPGVPVTPQMPFMDAI